MRVGRRGKLLRSLPLVPPPRLSDCSATVGRVLLPVAELAYRSKYSFSADRASGSR